MQLVKVAQNVPLDSSSKKFDLVDSEIKDVGCGGQTKSDLIPPILYLVFLFNVTQEKRVQLIYLQVI